VGSAGGREVAEPGNGGITVAYDLTLAYTALRGQLLPVLRVGLQVGDAPLQRVDALVDSGAEISVIEGAVTEAAGIDPTQGFVAALPVAGIAGPANIFVYVHRVTRYVGTPVRFRAFATDVGFAQRGVRLTTNVLGRRGFLDRVRVGFDGTAIPPCLYLGSAS
jgi:hypothetical protein